MKQAEKALQTNIKKWLEERGCVVLKTAPGVLNPTGIPDLLVLYKDRWAMIEVKASSVAEFQVLQQTQISRFRKMNGGMVYIVWPERLERVKELLTQKLLA